MPGCPQSPAGCPSYESDSMREPSLSLIASADFSGRSHEAVVIFSVAMDYVYYRGNHKYYLP